MEEKELLTILTKQEHESVLVYLRGKFGQPKAQKRLSLQSDNYDQIDIDTRIRVTNGKVELMQKVGDWKNITKGKPRMEISIPLPNDATTIVGLFRIMRNLMRGPSVENIIIQHESFIWRKDGFEIKLSRQFGKSNAYNCEIEVFNDFLNTESLAKEYKIPVHLPTQTNDFWRKWNKRVNLSADELSEEELLKMVKNYL